MSDNALHVIHRAPKSRKQNRPPVLLVHGAWHGAWCWEGNFLDYFADRGFEVYAMDLRGHGKSPPVTTMRWNRIQDYVDDVASVIKTMRQPPVVIGHSMGGFVCQHLIHRSTDITGVGLLASVPYFGVVKTTAKLAVNRPIDFAKTNLLRSLYPLVADPAKAKIMFLEEKIDQQEANQFAAKLTDETYLGFLDMLFLDLPPRKRMNTPMLVVGGGGDTLFSPASQKSTAEHYGVNCHIIENAPHDIMLSSKWRQAADLYVDWINSLK